MKARTGYLKRSEKGHAILEFTLAWLPLFGLLFGALDFGYALFTNSMLKLAVNEGVRFGVTGTVLPGMGHDASIKEIVKRNSLGLLRSAEAGAAIRIQYYDKTTGAPTTSNAALNIVEVAVVELRTPHLAPLLWSRTPWTFTSRAVDVMEAYPGTPPAR